MVNKNKSYEAVKNSAFEYIPDAVIITDLSGKIIHANKSFLNIYGYNASEILGKDSLKISGDIGLSLKIRKEIEKNKSWNCEILSKKKDGNNFWAGLSASVVYDKNKKPLYLIALIADISEKKRAENEVKKERNFFDSICSAFPEGIDIIDENWKISFMNKMLLNKYGKSAIGRKCYEVYNRNKKPCKDCPVKEGLRLGEIKRVVKSDTSNGKIFEVVHKGIKFPDGKNAVLEIFRDITEREMAESKAKKFDEFAINRELKMIELKKEINELCIKTGEEPRYDPNNI